jgi:hypothetical protein
MKNSLVIFYFFILINIYGQQSSPSEILPLEVGNKWIYDYYQYSQSLQPHITTTADGVFVYQIIGKDSKADSTIWHFYQKWKTNWFSNGWWNTSADSGYFDIIEVNNSNHQLIISKFSENSIFLFARTDIDNLKFYKNYSTNDKGKAFYKFDFMNSAANERFYVDQAVYECDKDSGITYLFSSKNNMSSHWTRSFKLREFIKRYQEPYLTFLKSSYTLKTRFGTPKDSSIEIRNDGLKSLIISNVTSTDSKFSILDYPSSILPESRGKIKIRFAYDKEININSILTITCNAIGSRTTVPLTGIAYGESQINLNWVEDHLYALNKNIAKYIFPITNAGNVDLVIDSITIDNSTFSKRKKAFLIKPGNAVIDTIIFSPVTTNYYKGNVSIFNNSTENPRIFTIWGYSGEKGNVKINLHKISFPKTKPGSSRDTSIVITNNGPEPIYISSENKMTGGISFVDDFDTDLLNSGQSRNWKIKFGPANEGFVSDAFYFSFINQFYTPVFKDTVYVEGNLLNSIDGDNFHNVPTKFSLSQNYPNPFNPSTIIKYSIPVVDAKFASAAHVTLKVYDVLGREVAILVEEMKSPGRYEVKFNVETLHGASLPSEVYFYRLQSGIYSETKKLILLK